MQPSQPMPHNNRMHPTCSASLCKRVMRGVVSAKNAETTGCGLPSVARSAPNFRSMRYQTQMPHIALLTQLSPDEVRVAIAQFSKKYKEDWKQWTNRFQSSLPPESLIASEFGSVLRKWQATRPRPMRRPRNEAFHTPPYLEDLLTDAWPHLKDMGDLSVSSSHRTATKRQNMDRRLMLNQRRH